MIDCLDCKHCYVDDLYFEVMCDLSYHYCCEIPDDFFDDDDEDIACYTGKVYINGKRKPCNDFELAK